MLIHSHMQSVSPDMLQTNRGLLEERLHAQTQISINQNRGLAHRAGIHLSYCIIAVQNTVMFCATADSRLSMQHLLSKATIGLMLPEVYQVKLTSDKELIVTNVHCQLRAPPSSHSHTCVHLGCFKSTVTWMT